MTVRSDEVPSGSTGVTSDRPRQPVRQAPGARDGTRGLQGWYCPETYSRPSSTREAEGRSSLGQVIT